MSGKVVDNFFKNFSRGNAELAIKTYIQKYGKMSQETLLQNIRAGDLYARAIQTSISTARDKQMASQNNDFRIWFLCVEWICRGIYTTNTCIWYKRKFKDYQQALVALTSIAEEHDCELFGYPDFYQTRDFIVWPKVRTKENIDLIRDKVNGCLYQWGETPALISDIRLWSIRKNLLNPGQDEEKKCPSCNCR